MLGQLIANGRTSDVYRFGADGAVKVLNATTPQHWAQVEAASTMAVRRLGVPSPEVRDVIVVEGRAAVVFERIEGPSLWRRMLDHPSDVGAMTRELVSIQRAIHQAGVPDGLPSLVDRIRLKIIAASELEADDRSAAMALLDHMPHGAALLHGDLHPGNVLLSANGPVVIDWFDATVGHPSADIARTMLLLSRGVTDLRHLPEANDALVETMQAQFSESVGAWTSPASLHSWCRLRAAARLAERADLDVSGLLAMWRDSTPGSVADDD